MGFVDDDAIPFGFEDGGIFIERAFIVDGLRAAQVLHRGEVNEISAVVEQMFKRTALVAVNVIGAAENFIEVVVPASVDNGAVRNDYSFPKIHLLSDFKGAECLAETHFSVPEKFVSGLEVGNGFVNGVVLFGAEDNFFAEIFFDVEKFLAQLDGGDCAFSSFQVNAEPFAPASIFKVFPIIFQQAVNVVIAEGIIFVINGKLGVQKVIGDICRARVIVDTFFGGAF